MRSPNDEPSAGNSPTGVPAGTPAAPQRPERRSPRRRALLFSGGTALVLGAAGLVIPAPYVLESPGPTFNTIGEIGDSPLITINGEQTYPTAGELALTTVFVSGGPNGAVNMGEVVASWLDPEDAVLPVDFVYPPGTTRGEIQEGNAAAMTSSQESAVAAALDQLEIPFTEELSVAGVMEDAPAEGILEAGDILLSVDGTEVTDVESLREALNETDGAPARITVRRDGQEQTLEVTPVLGENGTYQMGAYLSIDFTFPFEVEIALENVGGASAGMMFALGIIDKLTPGELTEGRNFAGTGTIDADGRVGPIGGIEQKMVGAAAAGAEFFLAPEANCDEVVGNIPEGLEVVSVETLDQALNAVETLAAGNTAEGLARCSG
ncbi:PDZ domain-containing protein [Arthrobacter sp. 3Tela_A]|uniref:YlbL family protein n=1 Tax=Arthrobacter sp. 3Tela_A TaxID=3093743 RepID=UPI003BB6DC47